MSAFGEKPPSADVVCESSPINLLSPAGHSPSLLSAVPFQLLSEGVTMSLDISTEGQSVPLHGSSVLFHVLNFLTEGGMCLWLLLSWLYVEMFYGVINLLDSLDPFPCSSKSILPPSDEVYDKLTPTLAPPRPITPTSPLSSDKLKWEPSWDRVVNKKDDDGYCRLRGSFRLFIVVE